MFNVKDDGTVIIIMYVYTDEIEIRRIAVRVDTDSKHFTTADINNVGMSVTVTAINQMTYLANDLKQDCIKEIGKTKKRALYQGYNRDDKTFNGSKWMKYYDCHYDNYYITVPYGIMNAKNYGYIDIGLEKEWICAYDSEHNNQHMIVVHPYSGI